MALWQPRGCWHFSWSCQQVSAETFCFWCCWWAWLELLDLYILEMFGLTHSVKTLQCNLKNLFGSSPAPVSSTHNYWIQFLKSICKFTFTCWCCCWSFFNQKHWLVKLFFDPVGRLCNKAFINLFVNQNLFHVKLSEVDLWSQYYIWDRKNEKFSSLLLSLGTESITRVACCNSLKSWSYIDGVGFCLPASTSEPMRCLSVSFSKLKWNYWFDVLMM